MLGLSMRCWPSRRDALPTQLGSICWLCASMVRRRARALSAPIHGLILHPSLWPLRSSATSGRDRKADDDHVEVGMILLWGLPQERPIALVHEALHRLGFP